jgi:predicted nucleic acid-binding protein
VADLVRREPAERLAYLLDRLIEMTAVEAELRYGIELREQQQDAWRETVAAQADEITTLTRKVASLQGQIDAWNRNRVDPMGLQ